MKFADYFSRNPNGAAKTPSEKDTHFIINQINDFKFISTQNTLRANRSYSSSQNNQLSNYDAINRTQNKQTQTHAFCQSRYRNKLHSITARKFKSKKNPSTRSETKSNTLIFKFTSNYSNNIINSNHQSQNVNVVTRNRTHIETSSRPIIRRFRRTNKTITTPKKQRTRPHLGPHWLQSVPRQKT